MLAATAGTAVTTGTAAAQLNADDIVVKVRKQVEAAFTGYELML